MTAIDCEASLKTSLTLSQHSEEGDVRVREQFQATAEYFSELLILSNKHSNSTIAKKMSLF